MSRRPPVIDWSADFDHLDPRWTENPYPIWDELRQKCPIAHTERFMGAYFATRYNDVRLIAYDTEHFSSRRPVVRETRAPLTPAPPDYLRPAKSMSGPRKYYCPPSRPRRSIVTNPAPGMSAKMRHRQVSVLIAPIRAASPSPDTPTPPGER
jgi:hypothetical protein